MTVLLVDLLHELLDELLLVVDDLGTGGFLHIDVLFKSKIAHSVNKRYLNGLAAPT